MAKTFAGAGFFCACCNREQVLSNQVNRSGYCVECYGHCVLAGTGRCDIAKPDLKVKSSDNGSDKGFTGLDDKPEMFTGIFELSDELRAKLNERDRDEY